MTWSSFLPHQPDTPPLSSSLNLLFLINKTVLKHKAMHYRKQRTSTSQLTHLGEECREAAFSLTVDILPCVVKDRWEASLRLSTVSQPDRDRESPSAWLRTFNVTSAMLNPSRCHPDAQSAHRVDLFQPCPVWQGRSGLGRCDGGCGKCFLTVLLPHPQFAEKFQEVREAARLAREKSQDGGEFTSPALALSSHQVGVPVPVLATPMRQL